MVPVFKIVGKRSTAKNYRLVGLLSVVSKVFETLVNNRIVDHLEKCGHFFYFQYGFRPTVDLHTVVSDTIARSLNRSGATQAAALDISKAFNRVWHAGLLHKLRVSLMEFQVKYFALFLLFSVIDGFEWFWMRSFHKNIQLLLEFLKALFLVLHFSYYILMTFLMLSVILLFMLMILISILSVIRQFDLRQQLELAYELESDLRETVDWGRKQLVDFSHGKTHLVLFDRSNNTGAIDVKMDGSVPEEKLSFKMLGLTLFPNWIGVLTLSLLLKLPPRKLEY